MDKEIINILKETYKALENLFFDRFLKTDISDSVVVEYSVDSKKPFNQFEPSAKVIKGHIELTKEI